MKQHSAIALLVVSSMTSIGALADCPISGARKTTPTRFPGMRYLFAFLLPPLAVLLCGRPVTALLNCLLTLLLWIPGVIHALFVVADHNADVRNKRLVRALKEQP